MTPTESKTPLTPEEIEAIRARGVAKDLDSDAKGRDEMVKEVDTLIAFLQANRQSIGGVTLVTVARHDSVLVDLEDRDTYNAKRTRLATDTSYNKILITELEALLTKEKAQYGPRNPLRELFG